LEKTNRNLIQKTYSKSLLGATFELILNGFQTVKINQFLGCIRQVKNQKINSINCHNQENLQTELYNNFKEKSPEEENPYKYEYPDQTYSYLKDKVIDFIGPLTKESYKSIYTNGKHYLERTPSQLYRNSLKDLLNGNKKQYDLFRNTV
jgi:hypothetical protein